MFETDDIFLEKVKAEFKDALLPDDLESLSKIPSERRAQYILERGNLTEIEIAKNLPVYRG